MEPFRAREADDSGLKSNNLWVGSLTTGTTESDLRELFRRYGDIDSITAYSSRSFAFIYYRLVEDAVVAKEALQGANLNGSQIKIDYVRQAKPCKSLWVGGICPSVSKDDLEKEFSKFGKMEDFRFLRERKTAFIDYYEMDHAVQAKSMNGKPMGGSYLSVDFLRSQAPRKEQWAKPSKVLWIGYPPAVQIDEQMLHNAMILFGEIERIKSYSLVEFKSAEEARRAKEGLQGRLFQNPRITIMYSNDEMPPEQDNTRFNSGVKRSRPNPGSWEGYDPAQLDREIKRTRRDGLVDGFTPMGVEERSFRRGSVAARPIRPYPSNTIWRGMIANCGTPVCHVHCAPIGMGIQTKLPKVFNCSDTIGLDMLAKFYTQAIGFEAVYFLPAGPEHHGSYTGILCWLGSKWAGVARFYDGTAVYLVPPSGFLTHVLRVRVPGQERWLYGVVLRYPIFSVNMQLPPPPRHPPAVPVAVSHRPPPPRYPPAVPVAVSHRPPPPRYPPAVPVAFSHRQESQTNPLPYMDQARDSPANVSHSLYPPRENYGPIPSYQQANYHGVTTNQAHNVNPSQFQAAMQPPADKANLEPQSQAPQLQPMLSGANQGTTDGEVDKNERYQSTLLLAANILQQIQQTQQQQSSGTPAGQGP